MRKMKKLAALCLAMLMAVSCMVMPAMAADDGIMPLGPAYRCSVCGAEADMFTSTQSGEIRVNSCNAVKKEHYHDTIIVTKTIACKNGHSVSSQPETIVGSCRG